MTEELISKFRPERIGSGAIENGHAFQKLCFDLLRSKYRGILFSSFDYIWTLFPRNQKDGGIDIVGENGKDSAVKVFVQCKLGLNKKGTEKVIDEIISDLKKQLNSTSLPTPYRPWVECKTLSEYIICLARHSSNLQKLIANQDKVQNFLLELSDSKHEKFRHLANVKVKIIFWDDLYPILERDVYLYHKWMKSEPYGLKVLKPSVTGKDGRNATRFKDYLKSNCLPYISRSEFKQKVLSSKEGKYFHDEHSLISTLSSYGNNGIIIYGQGGIGKTRLMMELGEQLRIKKHTIIEIDKDYDSIDGLIHFLKPTGNYILLFDYIEEQKIFKKTAEWLATSSINFVKIIANCRTSYTDDIRDLQNSGLRLINVGTDNPIEQKYKKHIVKSVISTIQNKEFISQIMEIETFCQERPSFAVFIKYMHEVHNIQENIYKTKEGEISEFSDWVLERLKLSIVQNRDYSTHKFYMDQENIFKIVSCLPLDGKITSKLKVENIGEISSLSNDGWIEEEDQRLNVVHDTVADTLLFLILRHYDFRKELVERFTGFALSNDSIASVMRSIERVWDKIPYDKVRDIQNTIARFVEEIIKTDVLKLGWFYFRIDTTQLLREEQRINLLFFNRATFKQLFDSKKFGSSLGFSMNWLFRSGLDDNEKTNYADKLRQLYFDEWNKGDRFEDFVDDSYVGGKIISSYINLYGIDEYISTRFNVYLDKTECNANNLEPISYVVVAWLKRHGVLSVRLTKLIDSWFHILNRENLDEIDPSFLVDILIERADYISLAREGVFRILIEKKVSFKKRARVISIWLDRSDDTEFIRPFITDILEEEISPKIAYYIIGFWLSKGSSPLLVKPFISTWLKYEIEPSIWSYIFQNWLEKGDDPNILVNPIKRWVKIEQNQNSIGNVLGQFLQKKGDVVKTKDEILEWLTQNFQNRQSVSVLGYLLENLNDMSLLPHLEIVTKKILSTFPSLKEVGFIIGYWIKNGGNLSTVEPYIDKWLKLFGDSEQGFAIAASWLERNGNNVEIKELIVPWMKKNGKSKWASTLLSKWIVHGDDPYLVKDFIAPFFEVKENCERLESRYLITCWLEKTNMPLLVKKAIKPWLAANGKDVEGVLRVCSFWLYKGDEINIVQEYIAEYSNDIAELKDCNQLIENWISKGGDLRLISELVRKYLNNAIEDINTIYVAQKWLRKDGSHDVVDEYIKTNFIRFCHNKDSFNVVSSYLNNEGHFEVVKPAIKKYLQFNFHERHSIVGVKMWITHEKSIDEIREYIAKIIPLYKVNPLDKYVSIDEGTIKIKETAEKQWEKESSLLAQAIRIKKQLINGQSPESIKGEVSEVMKTFGLEREASYIIASWIEYGNDFDFIKEFITPWLDDNMNNTRETCFVIAEALQVEKGFYLVQDKAIEWLSSLGKTYEAKFVLSSWLKFSGNKNALEIENWIFYWVDHLYDKKRHNWRDDLLLDYVKSQ